LREWPGLSSHDAEDLQRRHQTVTGAGMVAKDQMPTLLAPKLKSFRSISSMTFLSPTAVRDFAPALTMAGSRPALLIRWRQGFFRPKYFPRASQRSEGHDVVAVNQFARLVAEQHAVGVAVMRDADVRAVLDNAFAHGFRVHGSRSSR